MCRLLIKPSSADASLTVPPLFLSTYSGSTPMPTQRVGYPANTCPHGATASESNSRCSPAPTWGRGSRTSGGNYAAGTLEASRAAERGGPGRGVIRLGPDRDDLTDTSVGKVRRRSRRW